MKRFWTRVALLIGGTIAMTQPQMEANAQVVMDRTPAQSKTDRSPATRGMAVSASTARLPLVRWPGLAPA